MESLDRVTLANRAKEGIDEALSDLSGLGNEYEVIRNSGSTVNIPIGGGVAKGDNIIRQYSQPVISTLKEYGLSIDGDGLITRGIKSKPIDDATVNAIQDFINTYGKTGSLTADEFLNVRQAADRIVDWSSKSPDLAESFARSLRGKYDALGKAQIEGLEALDNQFSPMRQELSAIKRDFLTPQGQLKDTAYTTLANLTNKGREQVLARLEKYVPGITEEINILRAIEDIEAAKGLRVGAYTKAGLVAGSAALVNPLAGIGAFILSHPAAIVPMLRKYGELKRSLSPIIDSAVEKMKSGTKLTQKEKSVVSKALMS
jgi:hypothetical protein